MMIMVNIFNKLLLRRSKLSIIVTIAWIILGLDRRRKTIIEHSKT